MITSYEEYVTERKVYEPFDGGGFDAETLWQIVLTVIYLDFKFHPKSSSVDSASRIVNRYYKGVDQQHYDAIRRWYVKTMVAADKWLVAHQDLES